MSVPFIGAVYSYDAAAQITEVYSKMSDNYMTLYSEVPDYYVESFDGVCAVGIYVDGAYLCTVSADTAGELKQWLSQKAADMKVADPAIVGVGFDKAIQFSVLKEAPDAAYMRSTSEVLSTLEADTVEYRTYEIKPGDTFASVAESLGFAMEDARGFVCTYNGNDVPEWTENLIVGSKLQVPYYTPFISMQYQKYGEETEYTAYTVKEIYDDTMYDDEMNVITEGEYGQNVLETLVTYDMYGSVVCKEVLKRTVIKKPVNSVVRKGTMVRVQKAEHTRLTPEDGYVFPVDYGKACITAYMGDGRGHKGIDIAAPYSTPVYAAASGTVDKTGSGWNGGYGTAAVIANDDGNMCRYAHLSWLIVEKGDYVQKGQLIGYVGSTGDSQGNHLHFEVFTPSGVLKNPVNYLYIPD